MIKFYVTSLIVNSTSQQNVRDIITALNREDAANQAYDKYAAAGYQVIKQRVVLL